MRETLKKLRFYTDLTERRLPILHLFFILRLYVKQTNKLLFTKRRMMNMKKFTCLGLSMVLAFGLLAGCGGGSNSTPAPTETGSAEAPPTAGAATPVLKAMPLLSRRRPS